MSLVAAAPEDVKMGEHMHLADVKFLCGVEGEDVVGEEEKESLRAELLAGIKERTMSVFYEECCDEGIFELDEKLMESMKSSNEAELSKINESLEKAKKEDGEIEIMDALLARADFFFRIGDKMMAIDAAQGAIDDSEAEREDGRKNKALSTGQKIDLTLKVIRVGLFHRDVKLLDEYIVKAKQLIEAGGDWDRRNRLKVYESAHQIMKRDFAAASENMLSSVATFTCYELMTYADFIARTVLVAMHVLERKDLQEKVLKSSDVLAVIRSMPDVGDFLRSLHECKYDEYMRLLVGVDKRLRRDRFMHNHASFYVKEMRVKAYTQFLVPYKSVNMTSMAAAFGVSVTFVDRELFRFISNGRLAARIDKTADIVETNRPDEKNAQYQAVIKHGDALLNRIQKLARVINV
eukprot:g3390.t1